MRITPTASGLELALALANWRPSRPAQLAATSQHIANHEALLRLLFYVACWFLIECGQLGDATIAVPFGKSWLTKVVGGAE